MSLLHIVLLTIWSGTQYSENLTYTTIQYIFCHWISKFWEKITIKRQLIISGHFWFSLTLFSRGSMLSWKEHGLWASS